MPTDEELFNASIAKRLLPTGARSNPAYKSRVLKRLREMSQCIPMRSQLSFQVTTANASTKRGQMIRLIEAIKTAQTLEVNRKDWFVVHQGINMTDHTGPPTIGNEVRTDFACIAHQVTYLTFTFRISHPIGKAVNTATA